MKKVLKILSHIVLTALFIGYIAYQFRTDPISVISGQRLSGEEVAYPSDWDFTDEHMTIAVESRPGNPHSVTTWCWVMDGELYIPAGSGSTKDWPGYVTSDPRVRLKIGDSVYPVSLTRVMKMQTERVAEVAAGKYPRLADSTDEQIADIWLFRVGPRT